MKTDCPRSADLGELFMCSRAPRWAERGHTLCRCV